MASLHLSLVFVLAELMLTATNARSSLAAHLRSLPAESDQRLQQPSGRQNLVIPPNVRYAEKPTRIFAHRSPAAAAAVVGGSSRNEPLRVSGSSGQPQATDSSSSSVPDFEAISSATSSGNSEPTGEVQQRRQLQTSDTVGLVGAEVELQLGAVKKDPLADVEDTRGEFSQPAGSGWEQLIGAIEAANANPGIRVNFVILRDVIVNGSLPPLMPNTNLYLYSRCRDARTRQLRRCIISGSNKFSPAFTSVPETDAGCKLKVRGFIFSRIRGTIFDKPGCRLTIRGNIFQNSISESGGIVYSQHASNGPLTAYPDVIFVSNTFKNNKIIGKKWGGGTVISAGDGRFGLGVRIFVFNGRFINNSAPLKDYAGGAISVEGPGTVYIKNSIFKSNSAESGGAIASFGTSLTIVKTAFEINKSTPGNGQSIYVSGNYWSTPQVTLCNSTIPSSSEVFFGVNPSVRDDKIYGGTVTLCGTSIPNLKTPRYWIVKSVCPIICKQ